MYKNLARWLSASASYPGEWLAIGLVRKQMTHFYKQTADIHANSDFLQISLESTVELVAWLCLTHLRCPCYHLQFFSFNIRFERDECRDFSQKKIFARTKSEQTVKTLCCGFSCKRDCDCTSLIARSCPGYDRSFASKFPRRSDDGGWGGGGRKLA